MELKWYSILGLSLMFPPKIWMNPFAPADWRASHELAWPHTQWRYGRWGHRPLSHQIEIERQEQPSSKSIKRDGSTTLHQPIQCLYPLEMKSKKGETSGNLIWGTTKIHLMALHKNA